LKTVTGVDSAVVAAAVTCSDNELIVGFAGLWPASQCRVDAATRRSEGTMKSKQTGITLIGFLVVLIVVGFFGYMAMKLVPAYTEYLGVSKAMSQVASSGVEGKSLDDLRRDLMFKMGFQYVDDATIKPKDITIKRINNAAVLSVNYESASRLSTTSTSCFTSTRA